MNVQKMTISERIYAYEKIIGDDVNLLAKEPVENFQDCMDSVGVPRNRLSCHLNLRSSDTFLGLPFNIASYALLTHMVAQVVGMSVGDLIVSIGSAHIYKNHIDQVNELLSRDLSAFPLCTLKLNDKIRSIGDFQLSDFEVLNCQSFSAIKADVAI
jgi:thymidylate synthase